ncbi:MAG: LppX_LprAFG lipoprotein [Ardenticatenaceae bacterium]|nr:LppX_LprAFG lipoprotein [Ardenticatenaceae bacterium]MCB9004811.1 LppX_LprAFG lipoprotein [Ardenticatenaceae bacterium]
MKRIVLLLLFILLVACTSPPPPELPAEDIVTQAAAKMQTLQGFHFVIDRSGAPAYLDNAETLSFRRAEGNYAAPDRAQAVVRLILPGLVTDVNVVSVGVVQWETNPLTGEWVELPPDWGFNPTVLFQEDVGLQAILAADLTDVVLAGTERLDEGPDMLLYKVTGEAAGERLYDMSGTLIGPDMVAVTMWVEPETFLLHRIVAIEPVPGSEEPSVWQVDFSQFDTLFDIEPPVLP